MTLRFFLILSITAFLLRTEAQELSIKNSDALLSDDLKLIDELTDSFLYNRDCFIAGKLYYPKGTKDNHPYWPDNNWRPGSVKFKDAEYVISTMKYDIEKDVVVVLKTIATLGYPVQLNKIVIPEFSFNGKRFIFLDSIKKPGYYELLYKSKISAWAKWEKADTNPLGGTPKYSLTLKFIILKENQYYRAKNLKDLYKIFSDKEEELKRFKKNNKLSFTKDKTGTVGKLTEKYNMLTK